MPTSKYQHHAGARRQRGVVLMIALIMLVAMTLSGLALLRSVDTTNFIAGNLAFQQSATSYGDVGTDAAATWLRTFGGGATLYTKDYSSGYAAVLDNPPASQSWDNYWITVLAPAGMVKTLGADPATGNTVSYVIQRMCLSEGAPDSANSCAKSTIVMKNVGYAVGDVPFVIPKSVFYRITSRIAGPRNTVSYIQTVVAI